MSDKKSPNPIEILQGELRGQKQIIDQINSGLAPVVSSIRIKKEMSNLAQQLVSEVRKITLGATKQALTHGSGYSTTEIMIDTFDTINVIVKNYEVAMLNSLNGATLTADVSRQIIDKIEENSKETSSRIRAFEKLQDSNGDQRKIGERPEKLRRKRQYASALDDIEENEKE